jgi:hypothetical protein
MMQRRRARFAYVLILPALIVITLLDLYPVVEGVIVSLQNQNQMRADPEAFVGTLHYVRALSDDPVIAYVLAAMRVIACPNDDVHRDAPGRAGCHLHRLEAVLLLFRQLDPDVHHAALRRQRAGIRTETHPRHANRRADVPLLEPRPADAQRGRYVGSC